MLRPQYAGRSKQRPYEISIKRPLTGHYFNRNRLYQRKIIQMSTPQELHDRSTRGEVLSEEEMAKLNGWYAQQDEAEARLLGVSVKNESAEILQMQIKSTLAQVASVTQQIQQLVAQNEDLRQEVAILKQHLAHRMAVPAL